MVTPCASNCEDRSVSIGRSGERFWDLATYMLTKQELTTAAVEAFIAELRVVCHDSLSDLEALDIFSDGCNDADSFVAYAFESESWIFDF